MEAPSARRRTRRNALQFGLFGVAFACLGAWSLAQAEAILYQALYGRRLAFASRQGPGHPGPSSEPTQAPARAGDLIGRIELPRLELSAMVAEGIGARTLRRAVGHVPGTALPGQDGNVGLAGHRDTFFRELKDIRIGDRLRITSTSGSFDYVVETAEVVAADRTDLLQPTTTPALTLVTCFPFHFVGPAPQRFVVRARLDEDGR